VQPSHPGAIDRDERTLTAADTYITASVTIRPLILTPAQRVSSNMARRIRHHPPVNFDSCSTG
jgi:hypothetical protein